jgi:hypothetical protein
MFNDTNGRKCSGISSSGERCQKVVKGEQTLCYLHNPAYAEERSATASKAARAKHGHELMEVKDRLKELAEKVVAGELTTAKGSVAAQIYGVALRYIEQQRKQAELEEVMVELDELREEVARKNVRYGWSS